MTWSREKTIAAGLGLAVALLIAGSFGAAHVAQLLSESTTRLSRTHEAIASTERLISLVKDVETGQRGYLLSGHEVFLEPYQAGLDEIPGLLDRIRLLTAADPLHEQVGRVALCVRDRIDLARRGIELRRREGSSRKQLEAQLDAGRISMDRLRLATRELQAAGRELLEARREAAERVAGRTRAAVAGVCLVSLGLLAVSSLVVRRHSAERKRAEASLLESRDELEMRVRERTADLARSYEELQRELRRRALAEESRQAVEAERQQTVARLQLTMDRLPIACIVNDENFLFTYWNPAAERLFGYRFEEVRGRHPFGLITPPESQELVAGFFERLARGDMSASGTGENVTRDGRRIIGEWVNTPLRGPDGTFRGILSMCQDVTQRVRAEQQVRRLNEELARLLEERTARLEAVSGELESFSYSVSHDLRAPLRTIEGFGQALLEDHGAALDGQARQYLERMQAAARRMGQLIEGLIELGRVSRLEMRSLPVDLGALARGVLGKLRESEPRRRVDLIVQDPLIAVGDDRLIRVALTHLLDNAWKFTRRRDVARIEVGLAQRGVAPAFFVKDNGLGFDMAYAEKLFGPFHRLHAAEGIEGTGIGLATVSRIVSRHGGRVWAEGAPDEGTTIFFTLPQAGQVPARREAEAAGASAPE